MESQEQLLKLKNLFNNFGLLLFSYFGFFLLLGFLGKIFPDLGLENYEQAGLFDLMDESPVKFVILATGIAPFLEEGVFRSLIRPSENGIPIFLCSVLSLPALLLIPQEAYWILKFGILLVSFLLLFYFFKNFIPSHISEKVRGFLFRYVNHVWLFSSLLFGLVHIGNYVESFELNLPLFLLIFPRIIAGYFFGKIKIENQGFIWPVIMHAMNNGIIVFFMLPRFMNGF